MTQINVEYIRAEIDALRAMGLEKEAMEKEAGLLGAAKGLFQGGKSLLGKGLMRAVKGGGSFLAKPQAAIGRLGRSLDLSGTKKLTSLRNAGKTKIFGGKSIVSRATGADDLVSSSRFKNFKGKGRTLYRRKAVLHSKQIPTHPGILRGQNTQNLKTLKLPSKPVPSTSSVSNAPGAQSVTSSKYTSQGTANLANTPTNPGIKTNKDFKMGNRSNVKVPQNAAKPEIPNLAARTPTGPTHQEQLFDWAKNNPALAAGGGLIGYNTLKNNNSGGATIVNN